MSRNKTVLMFLMALASTSCLNARISWVVIQNVRDAGKDMMAEVNYTITNIQQPGSWADKIPGNGGEKSVKLQPTDELDVVKLWSPRSSGSYLPAYKVYPDVRGHRNQKRVMVISIFENRDAKWGERSFRVSATYE